jgi:plastocyanin
MRYLLAAPLLAGLLSCSGSTEPGGPNNTGGNNPPPSGPPSAVSINMQDYSYSPMSVTLKSGGAVTWTNRGTVAHTATGGAISSGQVLPPSGGGYGGTGGGVYQQVFPSAGTYQYHCANHAQMTGTITVVN